MTRVSSAGLFLALVAFADVAMVEISQAQAQTGHPLLDASFPAGEDFCFGRTYGVGHLTRNPKQTVKSITIGGRNARRSADASTQGDSSDESGRLYISLAVSFRDGSRVWSGVCREEIPGTLTCKILPHRNRDSVEQGLVVRNGISGLAVEATGNWAHFRKAVDDDRAGKVEPDDRVFQVARLKSSSCALSKKNWSSKGPTAKFLSDFP